MKLPEIDDNVIPFSLVEVLAKRTHSVFTILLTSFSGKMQLIILKLKHR